MVPGEARHAMPCQGGREQADRQCQPPKKSCTYCTVQLSMGGLGTAWLPFPSLCWAALAGLHCHFPPLRPIAVHLCPLSDHSVPVQTNEASGTTPQRAIPQPSSAPAEGVLSYRIRAPAHPVRVETFLHLQWIQFPRSLLSFSNPLPGPPLFMRSQLYLQSFCRPEGTKEPNLLTCRDSNRMRGPARLFGISPSFPGSINPTFFLEQVPINRTGGLHNSQSIYSMQRLCTSDSLQARHRTLTRHVCLLLVLGLQTDYFFNPRICCANSNSPLGSLLIHAALGPQGPPVGSHQKIRRTHAALPFPQFKDRCGSVLAGPQPHSIISTSCRL